MDGPIKRPDRVRSGIDPLSIQLNEPATWRPGDLPPELSQTAQIEHLTAELAKAEERYKALESSVPLGIVRLLPSGFIDQANARAEEMFGVGRLANRRMLRYVDQPDEEKFTAALAAVAAGRSPQSFEVVLINADNRRLHCQATLHTLSGAPEDRVIASFLDMSLLAHASRMAKQAVSDLDAVVKYAVMPTVVLSADGKMITANERAAELLARPIGAVAGQALDKWIVEHSRESFNDLVIRRGRGPLTVDMVAAGQARRVRVHLVGVEWASEPGLVATLEDVTERERQASRDEREGRLASLGLLVAGVGHEVNNPLAFVVPNVSEVAEALRVIEPSRPVGHLTAAEGVEMLDEASAGLDRIASIVRDLRGFHSTDDTLEVLSVNEVVVDTLRLADARLRQTARVRRDLGAVPVLRANRGRLGQVVLNLLFNAAEAMPERERDDNRITVRTWYEEGVISLLVRDNGKGIDPEHMSNLFDPFFTTRKEGLGARPGDLRQHRS